MEVTRVTIDTYSPTESGVCGTATVVLDNCLVVSHLHIINGKGGIFVAFPNAKEVHTQKGKKRYHNIVYPCKDWLRKRICDAVIEAYNDYNSC